jgi:hypothetical protein
MFSYWKLVPFLCAFLEHVFLGYTFVLSLLVFVGARFLMLEACTVLAAFSEQVIPGNTFVLSLLVFVWKLVPFLSLFGRASVPRLHVRIVFNWLRRNKTQGILPAYRRSLTNFIT